MNGERNISLLRKFGRQDDGAIAVEMALISPIIVALLLGLFQYALVIRDSRAVSGMAASVAEVIADKAAFSSTTRSELQSATAIMSRNASGAVSIDVYHVVSDSSRQVSLENNWSTAAANAAGGASSTDWQIIKPYLVAGEGGVVACAQREHALLFTGGLQKMLLKSCNVGVPIKSKDIDWQ